MKRILSTALAFAMVASLSVTAFATETTGSTGSASTYDETNATDAETVAATNPVGTEDSEIETDGRVSTGAATVGATENKTTDSEGATTSTYDFYYTNDDDNSSGVNDKVSGDINVWAQVVGSSTVVYKLDVEWGAMTFKFSNDGQVWDPDAHEYITVAGDGVLPAWSTDDLDGDNNKLSIINHSNAAVETEVDFAIATTDGGKGNVFNEYTTDTEVADYAVVGNFYTSSAAALAAANQIGWVLADHYTADEWADFNEDNSLFTLYAAIKGYYTIGDGSSPVSSTNSDTQNNTDYYLNDTAPTSGTVAVDLNAFKADSSDTTYTGTLFTTASMVEDPTTDAYDTIKLHNASGYYGVSGDDDTVDADETTWPITGTVGSDDYNKTLRDDGFATDLYFAFSGQPDSSADLADMSNVGTITITVAPLDVTDGTFEGTPSTDDSGDAGTT